MKLDPRSLRQAFAKPSPDVRAYLLHGPDESGSRALARTLSAALGPEVERIDVAAATLRGDPARLADEAASIALFGGPRLIQVDGAGEESVEALANLLAAPVAGNPVVLIAGALRKDSKLLDLATRSAAALAHASYPPEGADAVRITIELGRAAGLDVDRDIAARLADAAAGDREVLAREIEKIACYLDAGEGTRVAVTGEVLDALLADADEGDIKRLVDATLSGEPGLVRAEADRLLGSGTAEVVVLRAVRNRLMLLAQLRAQVEAGNAPAAVMASAGKAIFWKDKDAVGRQLGRWTAGEIATAIERAGAAERQAMSSGGPGPIAIAAELIAVARRAQRRR